MDWLREAAYHAKEIETRKLDHWDVDPSDLRVANGRLTSIDDFTILFPRKIFYGKAR